MMARLTTSGPADFPYSASPPADFSVPGNEREELCLLVVVWFELEDFPIVFRRSPLVAFHTQGKGATFMGGDVFGVKANGLIVVRDCAMPIGIRFPRVTALVVRLGLARI